MEKEKKRTKKKVNPVSEPIEAKDVKLLRKFPVQKKQIRAQVDMKWISPECESLLWSSIRNRS